MYGCSKDCLILIPFRLPHISCFTLSRQLPHCGDWTPASVPPPAKGIFSATNTPVSPPLPAPHPVPSSYLLPNFAWFYIFFSTGQVLQSALSWCSVCTSVSEAVFWCIHGERCIPRPPTLLPSCFPPCFYVLFLIPIILRFNNNMLWCKSFFFQVIVLDAHWVVLI